MGLTPRLGRSKKPQEHQRLRGPATADHSGQDNQTTATPWRDELRIGSLLSSSRCGQTEPIHVGSTNVGSAITVQSRHNRSVYRQLCPAIEGQPVRDNFKSATIRTFMASRPRSRTITLVVTRAPASRHTLAAALSSAKPRLANTPARAQAARWWPKASMGRPHWQKRRARGSGSRRRRNKRVRNSWESNRTSGCVGTVDSATPAPLPL